MSDGGSRAPLDTSAVLNLKRIPDEQLPDSITVNPRDFTAAEGFIPIHSL
ncbi:hypothetical protein DFQ14_10294 [Halopolyspora algeriensis]|uniref:Uncharacterized protein n=1 Tax=Halopolyspora algeriensis TaxID=1500506 RepID=A0A368VVB9_9ACTN|nr:hypothetical protein [Halopolyspora algeriensis]RCW45793.1 hypothetical protein DFQ14_10294 [Halopolyspora algeriensis]TQM54177.1 hypothetical protein FHU43_2356 [Halopolyspora algeriensis]